MSKFVMPDGREYPIALSSVTNLEAKLLQDVTGKSYTELTADLMGPDGKAAFLWLAMRKADHHVNYDELEFPMGETILFYEEPDPTKGSRATQKPARSSSPRSKASTRSSSARTTRK